MRNLLIKCICVCIVAAIGYKGYAFYKERNDGFSLSRISTQLPNNDAWDIPATDKKIQEVNQILAQPFYYLGRGFQFFAFESSDGQYVLKFLRHQRLHPPVLYDWLPDCGLVRDIKSKKCKKRSDRVNLLFESLKIAYEKIPEETGLVYVHLNKTKDLHPDVVLFDLLEDEYKVPLDQTEFVLQHKALFVKPTIKKLMKEGNIDEAKERINQLFDLLRKTAVKGVLDTDGALIHKNNVGFADSSAMYIDAGRFILSESIKTKEHFASDLKRLKPLYKWLAGRYPPLAAHFDKEQKRVIEAFAGA